FIYSTYIYLLRIIKQDYPKIEVETIPGISAFNAAASRAGFSLLEGKEKMAVLPVNETMDGIEDALKDFDTVVLMKVGAKLQKVIRLLKQKGLAKNAVLISRVGHPNEKIIRNIANIKDKELGKISVILVKTKAG
ncbi:MAG TPA: precorrin-2 C(20)-methyltransferase, partial [Candidatus Omnitrophica bacterium]|nr:precorrin-2 C(20)-methyltransferase [Candidatus Omnitrophota bacterium]